MHVEFRGHFEKHEKVWIPLVRAQHLALESSRENSGQNLAYKRACWAQAVVLFWSCFGQELAKDWGKIGASGYRVGPKLAPNWPQSGPKLAPVFFYLGSTVSLFL